MKINFLPQAIGLAKTSPLWATLGTPGRRLMITRLRPVLQSQYKSTRALTGFTKRFQGNPKLMTARLRLYQKGFKSDEQLLRRYLGMTQYRQDLLPSLAHARAHLHQLDETDPSRPAVLKHVKQLTSHATALNRSDYLSRLPVSTLSQLLANRLQVMTKDKDSPHPFQVIMAPTTFKEPHAHEQLVTMLSNQPPWPQAWRNLTRPASETTLPLKSLLWAHGGSRYRTIGRDGMGKVRWYASSPMVRDWTLETEQPVLSAARQHMPQGTRGALLVCRDQALCYPGTPDTWKQVTHTSQGRVSFQESPLIIPAQNWSVPRATRSTEPPRNIPQLPVKAEDVPSYFRLQHQHYQPDDRTVTDRGNTGSRFRSPQGGTPINQPRLRHFYGRYLPNFLPKAMASSQWQD